MALTVYDNVKVATATTGTGTITIGSASSGYRDFITAGVPSGSTIGYRIDDGTNWEIGAGLYTTTTTPDSLLHFDGSNGSTTFTDAVDSSSWTASGTTLPTNTTAQFKFGTASIAFNGSNSLQKSTGFPNLGTGDWTMEAWVRFNGVPTTGWMFCLGDETTGRLVFGYDSGGLAYNSFGNSSTLIGTWTPSSATWYHIAFTRQSNTIRAFVNGTQTGASVTLAGTYGNQNAFCFGNVTSNPSVGLNGWMDEARLTKGTALYTASFTAPSTAFSVTTMGTMTRNPKSSSNSNAAISLSGSATVANVIRSGDLNGGAAMPAIRSLTQPLGFSPTGATYTTVTNRQTFYFPRPNVISTIRVHTLGTASGNIKFAVWAADGASGAPGTLLGSSGDITLSANVDIIWTPTTPILTGGGCWVSMIVSAASQQLTDMKATMDGYALYGMFAMTDSGTFNSTSGSYTGLPYKSDAVTYSTAFATAPTITASAIASPGTSYPLIAVS